MLFISSIKIKEPLSICSSVKVVEASLISVLSEDISLTNKASLEKSDILFWKKLYLTKNSPDEYPKFCKSLIGSISIMGYIAPLPVSRVEIIPILFV